MIQTAFLESCRAVRAFEWLAMSAVSRKSIDSAVPSRVSVAILEAKMFLLRVRRTVSNLQNPMPELAKAAPLSAVLAELRSPLYQNSESTNSVDRALELGKVENLRRVARLLHLINVEPGQVFSFWRQVGKCTRRRGFQLGRQIQDGCVVPAIGGGICQFTNALYEAAKTCGMEVIERHPHTRIIPGSPAERDADATVAWNHIDLRIRHDKTWQLSVELTQTELIVRILGEAPSRELVQLVPGARRKVLDPLLHGCATCGRSIATYVSSCRLLSQKASRSW